MILEQRMKPGAPLGGEEKLIYSLDSGLNWTAVPTPDSAIIFKMIFTDSLHGFGVGIGRSHYKI